MFTTKPSNDDDEALFLFLAIEYFAIHRAHDMGIGVLADLVCIG